MLDAACSGVFHLLSDEPYVIQVAIVTGFHLFPFRTEKLSPSAPMVLHTRGRVGSRRFYERGANSSNACPLLFSFSESLESLESLERLESFLWVADGMIDEQLGGGGKIQCFAQGILVHGHAGDSVHA